MVSQAEFLKVCKQCVSQTGRQGSSYLAEHLLRLWTTYRVCEQFLDVGSSMISVGAGSAYVEHAIAHFKGVSVTVVDFPEAIEASARDYERSNFKMIAHDLTRPFELQEKFDLALSCEIIEHIPEDPQKHIALLSAWLKDGDSRGHIVVTTPNLANLRTVMRLVTMKPIMPPARTFFGAVSYENEGVHRREYVPSEIVAAFAECGLTHRQTFFTENGMPSSAKQRLFALAAKLSSRFAQTMILVAQR